MADEQRDDDWLAHPETDPDLAAHRLLADGRSTALVRPDGEVDWWCAPDLDSPPLLWSLLDPTGGAARWVGARLHEADPVPAARALRTVLVAGCGRVECLDGLLPLGPDDPPALVRLVRALDHSLDLTHECAVGGFDGPRLTWACGPTPLATATATAPPLGPPRVRLTGPLTGRRRWVEAVGGEQTTTGAVLRTRLRAAQGEWAVLVLGVPPLPAPDARTLRVRLEALQAAADAELAAARPTRHWPHRATDALAVLAACTYSPTGAVVASPTTSLPEAPGGDRQFDYRFTWLRDASLAVSVASLLGRPRIADSYLDFVCRAVADDVLDTSPVLDVRGGPVPRERTVDGVHGWAGTRPIRVGNDARGQVQADALGLFCEAVSVHVQTGGALDEGVWDVVRRIADGVAEQTLTSDGPRPGAGIWELRENAPLVSEDIGRWLTLDRAVWVARGWRPLTRRRRWVRARDLLRDRVLASLLPDGGLPQTYEPGDDARDASALMAVVFGLLQRDDPRASRLVDATLRELGSGPHVYRYEPGRPGRPACDGFDGREGAFVPMGWWAVAALAVIGRVAEATARADALDRALPRLMSEEVEPGSVRMMGNTPLLWSHMSAARALYVLDAARLEERWGSWALWGWRLARYVSLRRQSGSSAG